MVSPDFARQVVRTEILKQDRGAAALRAAQVNSVAQQHRGKQDHLRVAAGGDKFSGLIRYHKIAVKAQRFPQAWLCDWRMPFIDFTGKVYKRESVMGVVVIVIRSFRYYQ